MSKKLTRAQLALVLVAAFGLLITAALYIAERSYRPAALKEKIEALLSDQLEAEVTIGSLEGRFFPRVSLRGTNLVVRDHGRTDVPPLLTIDHFEIHAAIRDLMSSPRHVAEVRLKGMRVMIPPSDDDRTEPEEKDAGHGGDAADAVFREVIVDHFEAPDTVITLVPRKPNKPPKIFSVHYLVMESVGRGHAIPYIAVLTNPIPKGSIQTSGTFGPWNVAHPARTPVAGHYVLANADLDTIDGLSGTLSSEGTFDGLLNRIRVRGATDAPRFQIDSGGQAVPLKTTFTATVDGSDGDTYLDRVDASFLDTSVTAKGAVIGVQGEPGRRVELAVQVTNGRVEDLLRLAVDSPKPLLRGAVQFNANILIPTRKAKVLDKLSLRGTFGLTHAKFTDEEVQAKLSGLSRHGQGKKAGEDIGEVMSNFRGRFALDNATARFSDLRFGVPGAAVQIAGVYALRSETMDFRGKLMLDATISQAAGGGVKGFFLKAVDPFFKKDGKGTVVPIRIAGTRSDPQFKLDLFGKK